MLQQGTTLENNKYQVEGVIGRGGFGYVYRARERLTGEVVAIKELVPSFVSDPQMVQRFIREARATLRLTHPHIARTYGVFQDRGTYYLAMEYLSGGSLAHRLKQGPLPVNEAVDIAVDLCEALAYAHGYGVVHCDIKPDNVLFGASGEAHLADFGIAHVSERLMTRQLFTATGVAMGTVRYMAPEQLEGVRDDPRLDVYAMGAMLYEMLAGRPYLDFETESTPASQMRNVQRIQKESPRSLRAVERSVPAWLAQVVERALRKAPEERFASAEDLRRALRREGQEPLPTTRQASRSGRDPASGRAREASTSTSSRSQRASSPGASIPAVPSTASPAPRPSSRSKAVPSWLWAVAGGIGVLGIGCVLVLVMSWAFSGSESTVQPTSTLRSHQTPAPVGTSTRASTPEPSASPRLITMPTPEDLVFHDSFDTNDSGWNPGTKDDEWWRGAKRIIEGKYVWRIDETHRSTVHRETPIEAPDDFYVSVDAQRVTGPVDTACYMLIYRKDAEGYYRFEVCDNQYYRVHLRYEDEWQEVIDWQESNAIRPGEVNNLAVNAAGDHFEFFINDRFVDSVDDDTLSGGNAGIAMTVDEGDAAVFEFDNFVLRKPDSTPSSAQGLILEDAFNADENGWGTGPRDSEWYRGTIEITRGKLVWEVDETYKDFLARNLPRVNAPDDFYTSVDVRRLSGSADTACYNLIYRKNEDGYYRFRVCDGEHYRVSLMYGGEWETLMGWTETSAIRPGEVNNLAISAVGDHFEFFINDRHVGSVDDDTLSSGDAGVAVDANEGDVAVFEFDNFVLREEQ